MDTSPRAQTTSVPETDKAIFASRVHTHTFKGFNRSFGSLLSNVPKIENKSLCSTVQFLQDVFKPLKCHLLYAGMLFRVLDGLLFWVNDSSMVEEVWF